MKSGTDAAMEDWFVLYIFVKRAAFFVWTTAWGNIPTSDDLIKRGISLVKQ
jgi:hypothetical protein